MILFRFVFLLLILSSCAKDPISTKETNNENFEVSFLFEYDGIKVYRFYDDGRYHWFTSKGETICTQKTYTTSQSGKTIYTRIHYWDENI